MVMMMADYSIGGSARDEWERLWGSREQRTLPQPARERLKREWPFLHHATISDDPAEFSETVHRATNVCPICDEVVTGVDRVAASLNLFRSPQGGCLGVGVWAHKLCLEACQCSGEYSPIPW